MELDSPTNQRTNLLLDWLQGRAMTGEGKLPAFSNAEAAVVMGIPDMSKNGTHHGQVQSRLDFACFRAGLPPLGLAADEPFKKAWQPNGEWHYPMKAMAHAAKTRKWADQDFKRLRLELESLNGDGGGLWKEELRVAFPKIRAWAESFSSTQVESTRKVIRNPNWVVDELVLALSLYIHHRPHIPAKTSIEVAKLSRLLNKLALFLGSAQSDTYRNIDGVYMKLMNLRGLDPTYTGSGKKGLQKGGQTEKAVWRRFADSPAELHALAKAIEDALNSENYLKEMAANGSPDDVDDYKGFEGKVAKRIHQVRERDTKVVEKRKKQAIQKYGFLFCEVCGPDSGRKYGSFGGRTIDAHHTKPVAKIVLGEPTHVDDLALLCANCHRYAHASGLLTVDEICSALSIVRPTS
jgi:predicted HNH restriction endonuclease